MCHSLEFLEKSRILLDINYNEVKQTTYLHNKGGGSAGLVGYFILLYTV